VIEIIDAARCTACNVCVRICPTNVFAAVERGVPVIARQEDCQTCFQCEAFCPEQALYVSPLRAPAPEGSPFRDAAWLAAHGQLGLYRARVGWADEPIDAAPSDDAFFALVASSNRRP
jgi:NAD-dependent dihydropyrimidine dehydrogenase PreA subunit